MDDFEARFARLLEEHLFNDAAPKQLPPLDPFQYESLPGPYYIRVVKIVDRSSLNLEKLSDPRPALSMEYLKLDQEKGSEIGRYTTLSYTWSLPVRAADEANAGDEPRQEHGLKHEIVVNKKSLKVSQNLFDALIRLQDSSGFADPIWIDAICINQDDDVEKGSQVLLMDEIYSKSANTLVWLGKDETDVEETLHVVNVINPLLKAYFEAGRFVAERDNMFDPAFLKRIGYPGTYLEWQRKWFAFADFLRRRRYFSRGWVIQEFVLAQNLRILCGHYELDLAGLSELCGFLSKSGWQTEFAVAYTKEKGRFRDEHDTRRFGDEVVQLCSFKEWYQAQKDAKLRKEMFVRDYFGLEPSTDEVILPVAFQGVQSLQTNAMGAETKREKFFALLLYMVFRGRSYQITEKTDYIFAVLGLTGAIMGMSRRDRFALDVTYSLPIDVFYKKFTMQLIDELSVLLPLSFVEDRSCRSEDSLPSWVPDYSFPYCPVPLPFCGMGPQLQSFRNYEAR